MSDLPDLRVVLGAAPLVRDVVRVEGPEALPFLQGQLSQDLPALTDGDSVRALLLQPTGKVDAWVRVTRLGDDALLVDVDQGFGAAVLARLGRFKLRTKADLSLSTWAGFALRGPGAREVDTPGGALALDAAWPGVPSVDLLSEGEVALSGVPLVPVEALEALRIECGVPAMGAELTDATIPAEAGQWLIDLSVSFTKGCYTGQELVARIDSRGGNVPRPVRGLRFDGEGVGVGAVLRSPEGNEVGVVTSVGRSVALGPIGLGLLGRAVEPGALVTVDLDAGSPVSATVRALPLR